ncbi:RNA chaperone ProQ [compost metagenome]
MRTMGFEQLAELRDRLRAQAEQSRPAKPESKPKPKRAEGPKQRREPVSPEVEIIWRLQKHFPLAFPRNPAPKVPLKQGIFDDAQQHLDALGVTAEQLKQAIGAWCQGGRYWACLVENAERVDLQGQPAGQVTAAQAVYAKKLASRRARERGQERRAKLPRPDASPAPAEAAEADPAPTASPD